MVERFELYARDTCAESPRESQLPIRDVSRLMRVQEPEPMEDSTLREGEAEVPISSEQRDVILDPGGSPAVTVMLEPLPALDDDAAAVAHAASYRLVLAACIRMS